MEEKVCVLHTVGKMSVGGVQAFLMNYYKNIDTTKVEFGFAVQRDFSMDYDDEIKQLGGQIHMLPVMENNLMGYIRALKNLLREHPEYKIIHSHLNRRNLIPLAVAKMCGVPIRISHSHNIGLKRSLIKRVQEGFIKKLIKYYATEFFACSNSAGDYLYGSAFGKKSDFIVLKNAINTRNYLYNPDIEKKLKKEMKLEGKFILGHIGNFSQQKNYKFLLDVFKIVQCQKKDSVLLLIGDGYGREEIKEYVNELKLTDKVLFLGIRNDIPELLQAMDMFIFPSLFEGLGIVAIEAQAAGLKTLVSDGLPKEVNISTLIKQIPLSFNAEVWAEEVLYEGNYVKKINTFSDIANAGYDIKENAQWLLDYYLNKYKNR
jgi:glycosyltransferase involved in cell wall biosynthesis